MHLDNEFPVFILLLTLTERSVKVNRCHAHAAQNPAQTRVLTHPLTRWRAACCYNATPRRLSPAIDRASDPNRAALRHATDARFGNHRHPTATPPPPPLATRTTPTKSPPRQFILLMSQCKCNKSLRVWGQPPASLQTAPQNSSCVFQLSMGVQNPSAVGASKPAT